MILEYFRLQISMLARKLRDIGIHPIPGLLGIILVFLVSSVFLFEKTSYATPIYALLSLIFVFKLDIPDRNIFLKQVFKEKHYYLIRLIENLSIILPFAIFLIYKFEFVFASLILLISGLMAFISLKWNTEFVLPTPFYKRPFEFITGFRSWFLWAGLDYFLLIMAIKYNNYNLGLFSIIFLLVLAISSYTKAEDEYYLWNFSLSPLKFIFRKTVESFIHSSLLLWPVILVLFYFFPENLKTTVLFGGLAYVFLFVTILAKYASYPYEMQLPYTILMIISVFFPPLLLVLIPFLYWKATQHLNDYLV